MQSVIAIPGTTRESRYEAPRLATWLGAAIALIIILALGKNAMSGSEPPNGFLIVASLLCVVSLLAIGRNRDPIMSSMRAGFHGGMFGFFLSMPLIGTTTAELALSEATIETVGWSLILTVIGFEGGYRPIRKCHIKLPRDVEGPALVGPDG
jgi:hypothetical protein